MEPEEILKVRFHFGGEFVRIGPELDYVGGDDAISEIERDKLSLQEVKGFLKDHLEVKKSMKLYFHIPGKQLMDGLVFLHDDTCCVKMSDYICVGGVADVFAEYHGDEETDDSSSCSDFEDEFVNLSDEEPDVIINAEHAESSDELEISSPLMKKKHIVIDEEAVSQVVVSQVCNPSETPADQVRVNHMPTPELHPNRVVAAVSGAENKAQNVESGNNDNSDLDDTEYMPHSEDRGEDSEVVEMRKHARKFKKRMRDSKSWINSNAAVPINLVANMEEQIGDEEKDWNFESSDEDYSYDKDSDGQIVRKKCKYPRFKTDTEIPHFSLEMVFRSKNQLCKALRRYEIVTKRSIHFMKSEVDRVRAKCDWPGCPWLLYAAKRSRCSRFQVITYEDEHSVCLS